MLQKFLPVKVARRNIVAILIAAMVPALSESRAAGEVFTATDLAGASAVFLAFLAVGAAITIAMTLYRKGRQGANKV